MPFFFQEEKDGWCWWRSV